MNCARCPDGKVSETSGSAAVMRWPVWLSLTMVVQKWRTRSGVRPATGTHCQPACVSRNSSPGRLMQISVTSGRVR